MTASDERNPFSRQLDQILALVDNARKVAVMRQNRRLAADVLRACALYAQSIRFPCDPNLLRALATSIVDKNNYSLLEAFSKVEKELSTAAQGCAQKSWKVLRLPT